VTLAMNVGKMILLAAVAWPDVQRAIGAVPGLMHGSPEGLFVYLAETALWLAIKLAAVLLLLGVADYGYQRYQMGEDMKMTKQQVKEEYKDTDGNPEIKQKRRQLQRQMAQKRMMQDVPKADVVIRNPTHYAVALRYCPDDGDLAPKVIAKGMDNTALRIIEAAKAAQVPVYTDPPLARTLYKLEIGQAIPGDLFMPLVRILDEVYRHARRRPAWLDKFFGPAPAAGGAA
jgi:flagellar biosynthetic protein FlhB